MIVTQSGLGWHELALQRLVMLSHTFTVGRILNLVRNMLEYRRRGLIVRSLPPKVIIDVTNVCNLRCPLCATGAGGVKQPLGYMRFATFRTVFDQLSARVMCVSLFNWGEPFLSPHIFQIIDHVKASGAKSIVHSNLNLRKAGLAERIAESGVSSLVLSIDGADGATYPIYRKRGDWDLVIDNLRRLVGRRRALGRKLPEIVWKFIVHRHNEHQLSKAKTLARSLGVDRLQFAPIWADLSPGVSDRARQDAWADEWLPVDHPRYRFDTRKEPLHETACPFLWQDPVINVDATVSPCCFVSDSRFVFGDLKVSSFAEIWNNDLYRYSRSLFSKEVYVGPPVQSVCESCTLYRQTRCSAPRGPEGATT